MIHWVKIYESNKDCFQMVKNIMIQIDVRSSLKLF